MSRAEPHPDSGLTAEDAEQLAAHGIPLEEAERQLRLLRNPPPKRRLLRPCARGDGIRVIDDPAERERLGERFDQAVAAGRLTRMVPASGAASRMFAALSALLGEDSPPPRPEALRASAEAGNASAAAVLDLFERRRALSFWEQLAAQVGPRGENDLHALISALLAPEPDGLGYAQRPKGLIPFHRYPDGPRTPFEEHLAEAVALHPGGDRPGPVHFTVAAEHEPAFRELLARAGPAEVTFSHQSPATDTLAIDSEGRPFRQADGSLLLRPGGHGALLANLDALAAAGADLVQIKNIDNVVPERDRPLVTSWQRVLGGLLVELQATTHELLGRLEAGADSEALAEAESFARSVLGPAALGSDPDADHAEPASDPEARGQALVRRLDRPWRVCGMVINEGEPGGGPFWVRSLGGAATPQIVESAEIDLTDPSQRTIRAAATHFNPVDLVGSLRNRHGREYRLSDFTDPDAVFIAEKTHEGQPLRALERPGLWNGAMAHWNTVFVEVPAPTFAPVKTVFDLLRPEHQAAV